MRILWLTENYFPGKGGMAHSCDRIVHGLRGRGITVDLAHFTSHLEEPRIADQAHGRYIGWPVGVDASHAMNCFWNWIEADSCRAQLTHVAAFGGTLPMQAGPVFSAWLGIPLITLLRGNDFDTAVFTPRRMEVLRDALLRSSRVCVVTREKAEKIRALYPKVQPVWIPNGIDLSGWEPLPSHLKKARSWRVGKVASEKLVLGLFGHLKQKKGALFFLNSLKHSGLAERFHLLIVGEAEPDILSWLSSEPSVSHHLVPFVDRYELLSWYPACDLVVIPSFYDGLPNVLLEAAALGIPLLASRAGGMDDVLEDGAHGYLFRPGHSEECRAALAGAAESTDLPAMGDACRALIRNGFHHDIETDRYINVFEETLHQQGDWIGDAL